jgi:hypothetical protein
LADPDEDPDGDPDGAADAEPEAETRVTVWYPPSSLISLCLRVSVVTPSASFSFAKEPLWVTVQVRSAVVTSPFQAQFMSAFQTPGAGSVMWNSSDEEPYFIVKGSQREKSSAWRRRRAAAVVDGAAMGVIINVPAERAAEEAADATDDASAIG